MLEQQSLTTFKRSRFQAAPFTPYHTIIISHVCYVNAIFNNCTRVSRYICKLYICLDSYLILLLGFKFFIYEISEKLSSLVFSALALGSDLHHSVHHSGKECLLNSYHVMYWVRYIKWGCQDRWDPSHVPWLGVSVWFCFVLVLLCSGGSLLFCCLGVPCMCSYVMHGPNVMSSLFGSFRD